jgi:heme/copper-type cytochrome/quinol oxidase subunit 4
MYLFCSLLVSSLYCKLVLLVFDLIYFLHLIKKKKELSVCQSLLCLDLVSFPVLSQIKPQAPLLVVPFRQFL